MVRVRHVRSVRRRLHDLGRVVEYPEDTTVIAPGIPAPALGVVVSGRIGLRLAVPGVALRTILTLEDGDIFGWSALLPGSVASRWPWR